MTLGLKSKMNERDRILRNIEYRLEKLLSRGNDGALRVSPDSTLVAGRRLMRLAHRYNGLSTAVRSILFRLDEVDSMLERLTEVVQTAFERGMERDVARLGEAEKILSYLMSVTNTNDNRPEDIREDTATPEESEAAEDDDGTGDCSSDEETVPMVQLEKYARESVSETDFF